MQGTSSTSEESRQRAKRLGSEKIRQNYSSGAILHAAMMVLGELGYSNAKKIVKRIIDDPITTGDYLMNLLDKPPPQPVEKRSKLEALSYLIHHDLTEDDYRYEN